MTVRVSRWAPLTTVSVLAIVASVACGPISLPVLVTIAVLAFVWSWGDVLIAAVLLQSQQDWTVTLSATSFVSRYGVSIQQEAAAAIISMLPMVVIFAMGPCMNETSPYCHAQPATRPASTAMIAAQLTSP